MASLNNVELVEGDHPAGPEPTPRRTRRAWWVVAAVAVVAGLLVGGQAWLDHRHEAYVTRFDDVPGVLRPLPTTLTARWSFLANDAGDEMAGSTQVGPHLLAGTVSVADRTYTIREVDRSTGGTVWSTTAKVDDSIDLPQGSIVVCRAVDPGTSSRAACSVGPYGRGWPDEPDTQQVVVVDARDGSVVGGLTGRWMMWAAGDGQLVTGTSETRDGAATWTLTAFDLSGKQTWRRELPSVPLRDDPGPDADGATSYYQSGLDVSGSRTLLTADGNVWVLDDGVVAASFDEGVDATAGFGRGAQVVVQDHSGGRTRLLLPDGTLRTLPGPLASVTVDDGSAPQVLLATDDETGELDLVDAATGSRRAALLRGGATNAVVLGGRVYVAAGATVAAFDLSTGTRVWRAEAGEPTDLFTDGRAIYVDAPATTATSTLEAFALEDGARLPDRSVPLDRRPGEDGSSVNLGAQLGMLVAAPDTAWKVFG